MTLNRRGTILTTLGLTVACTGRPSVGGGTEGETEDSGSTTSNDPTNPTNPTNPNPTSVGTGEDETGPAPTTGPNPTTGETTGPPPGSDNCCEVHEGPGCNEPEVVDCVCAQEAFCCAFAWDQMCVDLAMGDCMATCEDPPMTTGEPGTTTGMPGADCEDIVTFEMQPNEATLSGAWELGMSMIGEGEIIVLNQMVGTDGTILFEPDIPCNDTWYVWVRYWEQGQDDSYFATIDGMPMPEAIFEGDCTGGGQGYSWAALNWRDQADGPCTYLEDPWAPNWDAGTHQVEFSYRESLAMGRILITNDQDLIPAP